MLDWAEFCSWVASAHGTGLQPPKTTIVAHRGVCSSECLRQRPANLQVWLELDRPSAAATTRILFPAAILFSPDCSRSSKYNRFANERNPGVQFWHGRLATMADPSKPAFSPPLLSSICTTAQLPLANDQCVPIDHLLEIEGDAERIDRFCRWTSRCDCPTTLACCHFPEIRHLRRSYHALACYLPSRATLATSDTAQLLVRCAVVRPRDIIFALSQHIPPLDNTGVSLSPFPTHAAIENAGLESV